MNIKTKFERAEVLETKSGRPYLKLTFKLIRPEEKLGEFISDAIATEQGFKRYELPPYEVYDSETCTEKIKKILGDRTFYMEVLFEYIKETYYPKIVSVKWFEEIGRMESYE